MHTFFVSLDILQMLMVSTSKFLSLRRVDKLHGNNREAWGRDVKLGCTPHSGLQETNHFFLPSFLSSDQMS